MRDQPCTINNIFQYGIRGIPKSAHISTKINVWKTTLIVRANTWGFMPDNIWKACFENCLLAADPLSLSRKKLALWQLSPLCMSIPHFVFPLASQRSYLINVGSNIISLQECWQFIALNGERGYELSIYLLSNIHLWQPISIPSSQHPNEFTIPDYRKTPSRRAL